VGATCFAAALTGFGRALLARVAGEPAPAASGTMKASELDETVLRERCSACHLFPEPKMEPRWAWAANVRDMYRLLDLSEELVSLLKIPSALSLLGFGVCGYSLSQLSDPKDSGPMSSGFPRDRFELRT